MSFSTHPYLTFLLVLSLTYLSGQEDYENRSNIDEIMRLKSDSTKVLQLLTLSSEIKDTNAYVALDCLSVANNISKIIGFDYGTAEVLYQKSIIFKNIGLLDSELIYSDLSYKLFRVINNMEGIGNNYNLTGSLLRRKGFMSSSIANHKKSLEIFNNISDSIGIAKTLNYIGIVYKDLALYDSALVYYLNLIRLSKQIGYNTGYSVGLVNLGQVYFEMGEFEKAKTNFLESVKIYIENDKLNKIALTLIKLGLVEQFCNHDDSAMAYFIESLGIYESINSPSGLGWVNLNIGNLFESKKRYSIALEYYLIAEKYFQKINLKSGILKSRNNIAVIYQNQGKFDDALEHYDTSLYIANEIDAKDEILKIYYNIHSVYRKMGQYAQALEYNEMYLSLKDSIFTIEKEKIIADLELKYETEKKEAQILTLNNENLQKDLKIKNESYRKNMYLAGGGFISIIFIFSVLFFRQRMRKNKQIAKQKLLKAEEEKKVSSAQALLEGQEEERIRISKELHDGVGVLLSTANLYLSSIETDKFQTRDIVSKTQEIVNSANTDVREISRNLMPTILSVHGLDDALQSLIEDVDKIPGKYGDFIVAGKPKPLAKPREVMVYRIVQELINNTMKHAGAESIDLELNYKSSHLIITYKDDGIGFDFEKQLQKKSVGLKSIQSRVDYLKGKMEYSSIENEGSHFCIIVPF